MGGNMLTSGADLTTSARFPSSRRSLLIDCPAPRLRPNLLSNFLCCNCFLDFSPHILFIHEVGEMISLLRVSVSQPDPVAFIPSLRWVSTSCSLITIPNVELRCHHHTPLQFFTRAAWLCKRCRIRRRSGIRKLLYVSPLVLCSAFRVDGTTVTVDHDANCVLAFR